LDTNEDRYETEEIARCVVALKVLSKLEIPVSKEFAKYLEDLVQNTENKYFRSIVKLEAEKSPLFSDKNMIVYVASLMNLVSNTHNLSLRALFAIDYLTRKIDLLENALAMINKKVRDLPTAEKLKEISDLSMKLSKIDLIMDKVNSRLQQGEKISEKIKDNEKETSNKYVS
jgi:hypothetical protein